MFLRYGLPLLLVAQATAFAFHPATCHRATSRLMATTSQKGSQKTAPFVEDPKSIRNVAFVGHSHAGKTALIEWMLYDEDVITQKPSGLSSVLDSDPTEAARHSSVFSHFVRVPHGSFLLEVSDTPWGDFPADALAAVDGADAAVVVVSASDGVQTGTVQAVQHCRDAGIKMLVALSKMDRPFVATDQVLSDLQEKFGMKPTPLQVCLGQGDDFAVEPLFLLGKDGTVRKNDRWNDQLQEAWMAVEEAVAMTDDDLLVEYLETSQLEPESLIRGLRTAVRRGKILPVVYTSGEKNKGVKELMDAVAAVLPSPVEIREEALEADYENEQGLRDLVPGVEAGFAARVLHTVVDTFGSLSIIRVISNSRKENYFDSLPTEAVNLRTGEKFKMPSSSTCFGMCGKERLALSPHVCPGDVLAVPKLPDTVRTNDILAVAAKEEEMEISLETETHVLTPLSRAPQEVTLMASATVTLPKMKKGSGGDDKLVSCLASMSREDLALRVEHDASGKILLRGMSAEHLQLVAARLSYRYGLDVELGKPVIPYRETLVKAVKNVQGKHKKQSGGSGQFGICFIDMEPLEEGSGIIFESHIKGGVISKTFIASIEKGVMEELHAGGPLGYPVTDVRVLLVDGKMHTVDSKDIAFQSAGRIAVKAALEKGKTRLMQPMEKVTFVVDEKLQGEVNGIVSRYDGYVTATNPSSGGTEIEAIIPSATIAEVSTALRAESAGEGQFTSVFSHYQPVPDDLVKQIVGDNLVSNES